MDLDKAITVTRLNMQDKQCYLLIGWQPNCFDMYLYVKDKLWKGRFSPNRLAGFSRNLHKSESDYYASLRNCLATQRDDYNYELKSGFFYWKRKFKDSVVIEGFLPMELDTSPHNSRPDLIEILLTLNKHLIKKLNLIKNRFKNAKVDYEKCLKDTEDFLKLKIDMEKALCIKFLNLLNVKKTKIESSYNRQNKTVDENLTQSLKNPAPMN
ncbi:uncharacterized protein LOC132902837 [Amyelois transitella]|uniref:uncharacterized protein LOC132902837 n=1 Tax=Amyelois transitella TaxID=680683 RepID=UPI00299006EC|nr:uncharacterized protein LOC132902837 [Amyelois transitella]